MSQNPLLGSRISLISKKNIRYEGTLYSINETDATVALQNVRAFGTEGRESENETFVPAQDTAHAYLLFRGCDIKDLHVHENQQQEEDKEEENPITSDPAILSSKKPTDDTNGKSASNEKNDDNDDESSNNNESSKSNKTSNNRSRGRKNNPKQMVGSGASLLRLKARGVVDGNNGPEDAHDKNFDFESNLAEFSKTNEEEGEDNSDSDEDDNIGTYDKNDFFDSISCDVSDRQNGVDNRLRGKEERNLNTETFGATSLGYGRRRYGGRGRGGRGRGRGRGRGGRGRENNRWKDGNQSSRGGRGGNRRTYGDGGLSANNASGSQ